MMCISSLLHLTDCLGNSLGRANSICPDIVTIPFDFELYKNIASKMYAIVLSHADFLQAVSIDEVLIEVATSKLPMTTVYSPDPALELAHQIRAEILAATQCEASIGASHNVLLARLATRRAKPANAFHLLPSDITEFLAPLSVESLPGPRSWRPTLRSRRLVTSSLGARRSCRRCLDRSMGRSTGDLRGVSIRGSWMGRSLVKVSRRRSTMGFVSRRTTRLR
jgi:DNA repair protein REV1